MGCERARFCFKRLYTIPHERFAYNCDSIINRIFSKFAQQGIVNVSCRWQQIIFKLCCIAYCFVIQHCAPRGVPPRGIIPCNRVFVEIPAQVSNRRISNSEATCHVFKATPDLCSEYSFMLPSTSRVVKTDQQRPVAVFSAHLSSGVNLEVSVWGILPNIGVFYRIDCFYYFGHLTSSSPGSGGSDTSPPARPAPRCWPP